MKFNPLPEVVGGKRLVVVDDSIVRGNTMRQIVGMLREAGATEVHLRISSPPIRHPCHYGIDMSTSEEMIAHERTVEEIAEELDADSLAYLSLEGVYEAIGSTRETHCDACFTGEYPLERHRDARTASTRSKSSRWSARLAEDALVSQPSSWRAGLRVRHQPAGDPRHGARARRDRGRRGRLQPAGRARRWSGRASRDRDGRRSSAPTSPAARRDRAMAVWLIERGVELVVLAGYMELLEAAFLAAFPRPRDQRPSVAAASLPRRHADRGPDRLRRQGREA